MIAYFYLIFAFLLSAISAHIALTWILNIPKSTPRNNRLDFNGKIPPGLPGVILLPCSLIGGCLTIAILMENNITDFVVKLSMQLIGAGAVLMYLIGILDDLIGISHRVRYLIHFFVALAFPCCNLYINFVYLSW